MNETIEHYFNGLAQGLEVWAQDPGNRAVFAVAVVAMLSGMAYSIIKHNGSDGSSPPPLGNE